MSALPSNLGFKSIEPTIPTFVGPESRGRRNRKIADRPQGGHEARRLVLRVQIYDTAGLWLADR
jgi:hypothetical protein